MTLIFHILMVAGFAAALAHPFLEAPSQTDETVVVFDNSASMSNDIDEAQTFVKENLGEKNTLIIAGEEVEVPLEKASAGQVMNHVKSTKSKDVKSDVTTGLETASDYEGTVVVASDLDQTVSSTSSEDIVDEMRNSGRDVKVMETEEDNSWGIVNVEPGEKETSVDVKNFQEEDERITASKGSSEKTLDVEAGSVSTATFTMESGKNTIELEEDGFKPDNKAYISVPENETYDIAFITEGNRYFEKAAELIEFVDIETYEPPVSEDIDADIYVVGRTNRILSETVEEIEKEVNDNGASMVVFGHQGVFNLGFESLPVEKEEGMDNTTVTIEKPRRIDLGKKEMVGAKKVAGESYANPEHALVKAGYGNGEVLFYNLDEEFRHNFMYPVVWKHVFEELTEKPSIHELNVQTGEEIEAESVETPSGETIEGGAEAAETGFYTAGSKTYAANLESEDESYAEEHGLEAGNIGTEFEKRDVQNLAAVLIALLIVGEAAYLRRLGEI